MSWPALTWAKDAITGSSSDKAVLLALAYRHNEDLDLAFPSIASIVEFTELDRKTVIAALARLEGNGFISDTGGRYGRTKQVIGYRLLMVPKTEQSQKRNSSGFSGKQSQKRDTERTLETTSEIFSPTLESNLEPKCQENISSEHDKAKIARKTPWKDGDLIPEEWLQWAMKERLWRRSEAQVEADRFIDSALANRRLYANWEAAWRNWCRSDYCKTPKGVPQKPIRIDRWD